MEPKSPSQSALDARHPILRQEYAVFTPPMESMIATIGDWIDQRVTGGYVYGPSRYGKSRTVKWFLRSELKARFRKKIPLIVWVREDTHMQEREFWNMLLLAAKYEFISPIRPKSKLVARFLFREYLETLASKARSNFIVLVVDEAQRMTYAEWTWLLGVQNMLDEDGFRLTVVSIGSHSLGFVPDYFARTGSAHIAARFFSQDVPYRGLQSVDELAYVLQGYDTDSEWPNESGTSFLAYFAPEDFHKGRRLADCAPAMWATFESLKPPGIRKEKAKVPFELPMQHVAVTVESMLKALGRGEEWDNVTSRASLLAKVSKTGFTDFMKHISDIIES